ncbi:hypothetical protein GCM10010289_84900 [Streptomyces violascens]|uniref:Uncharacterized protein n=1 Tax=Streptomyces violascens TaxID=67381 RepID=A0ABQ3QS28_9ACTN|nr:hypothetical protein GCM10010289_84900 [Streptomyces violascens]GHI40101.1 hypothetical protein Sviol_45090 [Streptomyces violascens]
MQPSERPSVRTQRQGSGVGVVLATAHHVACETTRVLLADRAGSALRFPRHQQSPCRAFGGDELAGRRPGEPLNLKAERDRDPALCVVRKGTPGQLDATMPRSVEFARVPNTNPFPGTLEFLNGETFCVYAEQ